MTGIVYYLKFFFCNQRGGQVSGIFSPRKLFIFITSKNKGRCNHSSE